MELERVQGRLDNIRSVEPILGALQTISLGSWQAALRQSGELRGYKERLAALLPMLLPRLPAPRSTKRHERSEPARVVALAVGSERGLCGRFNAAIAERAEAYLAEQAVIGSQVELVALGTRACRVFERRGHHLAWAGELSVTALPSFELCAGLTRRWLMRYEARELDAADVIYSAYRGLGGYEPTVMRLIPPQLPADRVTTASLPGFSPIIETDPLVLYRRVIEQWVAVRLYELLLESAAAEHAARYALTEAAAQNADRLIAELTVTIQTARQGAITREMQELAAGAGLLGGSTRGTRE